MPSSSNELHLKRRKLDENFDQKTSKASTTVLKSVLGQLDSITASSSDSLNQLFLKFLVENDIDFKTANSKYLQEFMEKIRPAYKFPSEKEFKNSILSTVYESTISSVKESKPQQCSLIVNLAEGSQYASVFIKPFFGQTVFIQELSVEHSSVKFDYKSIVQDIELKFNGKIVSMVDNCLNETQKEQFPDLNFHIKCHESSINSLWLKVSDKSLTIEVSEIIQAILGSAKMEKLSNDHQIFKCFNENLKQLKEAAINMENLEEKVSQKVFDKKFSDTVNGICEIMKNLPSVDSNLSASEMMIKWVRTFTNTSLIAENDEIYTKIFTKQNIAAYAFNPAKKDDFLTPRQKSQLRFFVLKLLNDPEEFTKFDDYLEANGEFGHEGLIDLGTTKYWTVMKGYWKKLPSLGLKFTTIPAISSQKSKNSFKINNNNFDAVTSQKISVIKTNL